MLQDIESGQQREVRLPPEARLASVQWSPDGSRLAFANVVEGGIELWVVETTGGEPRRLLQPVLNGALGTPFT